MKKVVGQRNACGNPRAYEQDIVGGFGELRTQDAVVMVFGLAVVLCAFGVACGKPVGLELGPLAMRVG